MDRYDEFLSKYLPRYLEMDLIDEIVITDENGHDAAKISAAFPKHPKLRLYVNSQRLGPFLNKLTACSLAKRDWIALIDSDNFADVDYFEAAKQYMTKHNLWNQPTAIISPCKARPKHDFSQLAGLIYKCGEFANINATRSPNGIRPETTLINTGNYILHKYMLTNVDLSKELENIPKSSSCDVMYMNTLFFEQFDAHFHVVPGMEYDHVTHDGSIYLQTHFMFTDFANEVHARYYRLDDRKKNK